MRTVLYAHDMEPITILELEAWKVRFLEERGFVELPVIKPMDVKPWDSSVVPEPSFMWIVRITAERFHRNGQRHLMLFTHNEEHSLLLKSAFLPGQRWALKELAAEEFASGFLAALSKFG